MGDCMFDTLEFYGQFAEDDVAMVREYLQGRHVSKHKSMIFGVVYDILHQCDLACVGCGTNALYHGSERIDVEEPSLGQVLRVFDKVKEYADSEGLSVFVNIGGGEPFLRNDIIEVLKGASEHFGVEGVGVDTNGTLDDAASLILEAMDYCSYVGISVNGLEEYHNWWSGTRKISAYQRTMATLEQLCTASDDVKNKLEVTSVATKANLKDIPLLIEKLSGIGISNYSIHRAMPVGRMFYHPELLPTAAEYFGLLIDVIKASKRTGIDVHVHHSIESIHETLLLGLTTYASDKVGDPDIGSSVGIEPEGRLVFDPWCTSGMWRQLCSQGCIYDDELRFENLLSSKGSVFDVTKTYTAPHLRCHGCNQPCSGGSRIVAAASELIGMTERDVNLSDLLGSMSAIDPACPLYLDQNGDEDDEF